MNIKDFQELIESRRTPNIFVLPRLRFLVDRYPYFQAGLFTYLKCLYGDNYEAFRAELFRLAIFVSDRKALFYYILSEQYDRLLKKKGKSELSKDRTTALMDAFFETIGEEQGEVEIDAAYGNLNLASFDYFNYLQTLGLNDNQMAEDHNMLANSDDNAGQNVLKHQDIIDSFINRAETEGESIKINLDFEDEDMLEDDYEEPPIEESLDDDDIFFTETLANIYIKQKKYEKAYEIIKRLNLNYPKKNIYFADQLAFLEKLIINEKNK